LYLSSLFPENEFMVRIVIIDDEDHIRDSLDKLLAKHCPQVTVVGTANSVSSGKKAIEELHPDLVLLDIQMNDGTGFDLLNAFSKIDFKVIFVSAFDKSTIRAFRLSDVEYLLKPVNPEELKAVVNRTVKSDPEDLKLHLQALENNARR